jgi:hypothetical protein
LYLHINIWGYRHRKLRKPNCVSPETVTSNTDRHVRAYLDFNIIVSLQKGKITLDELRKIDNNITDFPFSASHIQEVDNISHSDNETRDNYIDLHLQTIASISKNLYLYQKISNEVLLLNETPTEILNTIREVPFAKQAMQSFVNFVTPDQKSEFRKLLGINSQELNNYSPKDVVNQLNTVMTTLGTDNTFLGIIENAIQINLQGHTFGLSERFAAIYGILDLFGYWKDKQTNTSDYARLWDSNHAFFASHCNYFISDDLRNRYKAKVIYNIYDIDTKVVDSKGQE